MQTRSSTINTGQQSLQNGLVWALGALALVGLWASASNGLPLLWVLLAAVGVALVWAYPRQAFLLVVPLLFLEHDLFSLDLPFGRLRAYHVLIAVLLARHAWDAVSGLRPWKTTPLDLPLALLLVFSAAAVAWSPDQAVALKILGLEVLLAALYWLVVNEVRTAERLQLVLNWFVVSAAAVAVLGFAQLAAVWLQDVYGITLWSGEVIHSDILPLGRPYGTFVEPDWYGAVAMVALAISGAYALSRAHARKQLGNVALVLLFGAALVLSVVRGAWVGAAVALIVLVVANRRRKLLDASVLVPAAVGIGIGLVLLAIFVPDVIGAVVSRASSLLSAQTFLNEPRYLVVQEGIGIWLTSPWLGLGPGAFNVLGSVPFVPPIQQIVQGLVPFQTNAIVNVLIDTGVVGLTLFGWLLVRLVKLLRTGLHSVCANVAVPLLGLCAALAGLAVTYQVTTGLWLALTWFVLGLAVAAALITTPTPAPNSNLHV